MKTTRNVGYGCPILVALALAVALTANGAKANAQEAVFLVKSAERNHPGMELTDAGRGRAKTLANLLKDAGIDVIYSFERTHVVQTAEPTAKALNINVNIVPSQIEATDDLVRRLRTQHAKDRVFIATGQSSRERILRGLGLAKEVWKARTDDLHVIIPRGSEEPLVIKMRW